MSNEENQSTEFAGQMAALVAAESVGTVNESLSIPFTIVPEGYGLHKLEALKAAPSRFRGKLSATTPKAFVDMVKAFGDFIETPEPGDIYLGKPIVTVDRKAGVFVAILNPATWGDHRITFALSKSIQWRAWSEMLDKPLGQLALAEFLEEHTVDIVKPEGAKVLEIVKNLEVSTRGKIVSAVNLHNGNVELAFTQSNDATTGASKSNFRMPDILEVAVPLFDGSDYRIVEVKLRYRVQEDKVVFRLTVPTLEDITRKEIEKVRDTLSSQLTGVQFFEGTIPEIEPVR